MKIEELNPNEVEIVSMLTKCGYKGSMAEIYHAIESKGDDAYGLSMELYDNLNNYTNERKYTAGVLKLMNKLGL